MRDRGIDDAAAAATTASSTTRSHLDSSVGSSRRAQMYLQIAAYCGWSSSPRSTRLRTDVESAKDSRTTPSQNRVTESHIVLTPSRKFHAPPSNNQRSMKTEVSERRAGTARNPYPGPESLPARHEQYPRNTCSVVPVGTIRCCHCSCEKGSPRLTCHATGGGNSIYARNLL